MNHKKLIIGFAFVIFLVLPFVLADVPDVPSTAAAFKGNVTINGNGSTRGANISAYILSSIVASDIVGDNETNGGNAIAFDSGYFTASFFTFAVPCSSGDSIVFTVYNVTVNEAAQTCSAGSSTFLNLSITTLANGVACAWSAACTGGYCCSGATEYNGDGVGTCQASVCAAAATTSTGDGGGGGGGGGVSDEESQTAYTGLIQTGDTKGVTYSKEDTLKVTSIELTAASKIRNAGIRVKESSASKAGYAISADEGGAYKYLEITKLLISDDQVSSARIYFKVEKSWYADNGYDTATTTMRRKVDDAWQDLTTTKYKEDDNYYYFYSDTPDLSYFAIVAYKTTYVPPAVSEAVCGDGVCEDDESCSTCVEDCACASDKECIDGMCKKKEIVGPSIIPPGISKAFWVWIIAGVVLLAIIIIALAIKKKKK